MWLTFDGEIKILKSFYKFCVHNFPCEKLSISYTLLIWRRSDQPCFRPSLRGNAAAWCAGSHLIWCQWFCWGWQCETRKRYRADHGSWSYQRPGLFPTISSAVGFESDLLTLPEQLTTTSNSTQLYVCLYYEIARATGTQNARRNKKNGKSKRINKCGKFSIAVAEKLDKKNT